MGILIDGYSGAAALPRALRRFGYECVHVQSMREIPRDYLSAHRAGQWREALVFTGDVDGLAARLREEFAPAFVAVGAHESIWLADVLSEALGLPANGEIGRRLYLDKHLAAEALAAAGVPAPLTFAATTVAQGLESAARIGSWPVVVKPINSSGSDGVSFCHGPADVERACRALLGERNLCGQINEKLAVQQFVSGPAYATHTVSLDGHHVLVAVFEFVKRTGPLGGAIYDCFRLISPDQHESWRELYHYSRRCLDALHVKTGPVLGEIMLTAQGPMLIEINARLAGAGTGSCAEIEAALGHSHASAYAQRLCDPQGFLRRFEAPMTMSKHVWFVAVAALEAGTVNSLAGLSRIESLVSFSDFIWKPGLGDALRPCIDQQSIPALVVLSHQDEAVVRADYEAIRALEAADVFGLKEERR
ncbi:ATP-grasp domain-containing protein [Sorangium sp. So ce296]|uniref:ATP-grasp domain-containing protein n=1 Tax=Sorangium sp. So ce296 TaxID=3133296 RepID=UPI003F60BE74